MRSLASIRSSVMCRLLGSITNVNTTESIAALTFDDGPHPVYTPLVLEVLKRHDAHGTFFLVGKAAQEHKNIVKSIAEAGHAIGNHTWDHVSLPSLSRARRRRQIKLCQEAIAPFGSPLFRPPWGQQTDYTRLDLLLLGLQVITWNVAVFDWLNRSPNWMSEKLIRAVKPGSIVLLHDSIRHSSKFSMLSEKPTFARDNMLHALDIFLKARRDNMRFVTVPDLLLRGKPQKRHWVRY